MNDLDGQTANILSIKETCFVWQNTLPSGRNSNPMPARFCLKTIRPEGRLCLERLGHTSPFDARSAVLTPPMLSTESYEPDRRIAMNLERFVTAQHSTYDSALRQLRAGSKQGHWMWFIFPQIDGLGHSPTAQFYAIKDMEEATAYLAHPILGPRLVECCEAMLLHAGRSAHDILGSPDDLKLRSSVTLFTQVQPAHPAFESVLSTFFPAGLTPEQIDDIQKEA